ncbi:ABC transporter permease [uncultured Dialister sp.]|uniref:ABC transporter permease n=1 Tax=uncultured Dialister sp. TaxID=278064 RepID=UPI0025ED41CF|nr:ABC transporter permease [uncultured Dialister sp.]
MIRLAFLSLVRRPLRQFLLFLLIVLTAAVPVFILQVTGGLYEGINRAVSPFPILVGDKGSAYQLVLNTVFLRDRPLGNIKWSEKEKLEASGKVQAVYPLGFGDNYRGFRIAGTDPSLFTYRPNKKEAPWLSLSEGKIFAADGEAVIGSETARLTGLKVGDTFKSIHGTASKGHEHKHPFKVTGILKSTGGPYDTAIFISMEDVWEAHGGEAVDPSDRQVTTLLVVPKGYKEAMQLLSEYQRNKDVQMVFPSQSVISLYAMVGQTKNFWKILISSMLGISLLITLLVMYWSGLGRMKELALLEALGAGKGDIRKLLLAEEGMLLFAGSCIGWLCAYGATLAAARAVSGGAAITMVTTPDWRGFLIIPIITIIGMIAGLVPAVMVGKKDVSEYL